MTKPIDTLIINSAYKEPEYHWEYSLEIDEFVKENGRRSAGYYIAGQGSNQHADVGEFVKLHFVNDIRKRVKKWRSEDYPGVSGVTKRLIEYWRDPKQRTHPFFFCQLDAIETLIWLNEAPESEKVGIEINQGNNEFFRICSKMATGTGKTTVMAMVIAWHVLNKSTYPADKRFSKNVFVVAPGITVKDRLSVLKPSDPRNYYDQFGIIPPSLREKFNQGNIAVENWHTLSWDDEKAIKKRRSVDKRGVMSDEAYTRSVLKEMSGHSDILVINDEAHHAWKKNPEIKIKSSDVSKDDEEEATIWVGGLEKINRARGILFCYDFTATPFAPSGKKNDGAALFEWIVSDFGLNDAIESGLVKTPRVVVRDNALPNSETYKSKLYHIYGEEEIRNDLSRKAQKEEPLPNLVQAAYTLLGADWYATFEEWKKLESDFVPPVMISVVNRIETASRVKYSFDHYKITGINELCNPDLTMQIDSKILKEAESKEIFLDQELGEDEEQERKLNKDQKSALLRETVNTVGQIGKPGEQMRNIISVNMLSEGWDAKTVTHIMGLRAFSSQLLCEQVIGRGLRRTTYDVDETTGLFTAEYVNIFGIPFVFLPHEGGDGPKPPAKPKTPIRVLHERSAFKIDWPNVVRMDRTIKPELSIKIEDIPKLRIDVTNTPLEAELSPVIDGKTYHKDLMEINLKDLRGKRLQTVVFEAATMLFEMGWKDKGTEFALLGQLIRIMDLFIKSDKIEVFPKRFGEYEPEMIFVLSLYKTKIVQHLNQYIKMKNTDTVSVILDSNRPTMSTEDMPIWYTGKPCHTTTKSQISHSVYESTFESADSYVLEKNENVDAYVKNDHLGFEIPYMFEGSFHKYRPDFLIRMRNGDMLILETKGKESDKDSVKRSELELWVEAVNAEGSFGRWHSAVSYEDTDLFELINKIGERGL